MFQITCAATFLFIVSTYAATLNILNNCPTSIQVFLNNVNSVRINSQSRATFAGLSQSSLAQLSLTPNAGTFASFYFPFGYYYIRRDPGLFNGGVSIVPTNVSAANGFCGTARCDNNACSDAFTSQPQLTGPSPAVPPALPMHACNYVTDFTVTWCPDGTMPPQPPIQCNEIHPVGSQALCISLVGDSPQFGTPVQLFDCDGSPGQRWTLNRGNTQIKVSGTNFCLDAGNITNGLPLKVWPCAGVPQQAWFYGNDNLISVTNGTINAPRQCMDVTEGLFISENPLQTYFCTPGSINQLFTLGSCMTSPT